MSTTDLSNLPFVKNTNYAWVVECNNQCTSTLDYFENTYLDQNQDTLDHLCQHVFSQQNTLLFERVAPTCSQSALEDILHAVICLNDLPKTQFLFPLLTRHSPEIIRMMMGSRVSPELFDFVLNQTPPPVIEEGLKLLIHPSLHKEKQRISAFLAEKEKQSLEANTPNLNKPAGFSRL